ncbi:MAG: NAD-dependent epimerase/dehydratase family protein [Nanoarchaeota archaeon]
MNILVTGGAGFIGSHIVDRLVVDGHKVIVVDDLSNGNLKNLTLVKDKITFHRMSITAKELADVFSKEKPEVVFHLAAHINVRNSLKDPMHDGNVNILGSLNLLENCRTFGVKKIIFSSTGGAIYGETDNIPTAETETPHPISHYGISKFSVEQYLFLYKHIYGLEYIILRYANIYGPRQDPIGEAGVVSIFINNIIKGKDCRINGDGKQTRDYVYVGDVVDANMLALNKNPSRKIFNIGTGKETDVNSLFSEIKNVMAGQKKTGTSYNGPALAGEVMRSCLDATLAKKHLGWEPRISFSEGIKKTASFFIACA